MHPAPPTRETRVYAIDCEMVRRHFSSTNPTQLNIVFDRRQRGTNLGLRHRPRVRHRRMTTSSNHPNPSSNTLQSNASPPFWTHAHHPPSRWSGIADVSLAEVQTQLLTTLAPKGDIHPHRSLPRIGSQSPLQRHRTHVPPPPRSTTQTWTRMARQEMVSPRDPDVRVCPVSRWVYRSTTHLSNFTHWQAAGDLIYSHHILMSVFRFGTLHARIDGLAWLSSVLGFNR